MRNPNLLAIKEFSKLTGIKETTLRYLDKLGLFSPEERSDTGYRFYSPFQLISVNSIRLVQDLGIPSRDISDIVNNRTPESILAILNQKNEEFKQLREELEKMCYVIEILRDVMTVGCYLEHEDEISISFQHHAPIRIGVKNRKLYPDDFFDSFITYIEDATEHGVDLRFPIGGLWESWDSFIEVPGLPDNFFTIEPKGPDARVSGAYVTAYGRGYYGEPGDLPDRMAAFIKKRGVKVKGPVYCVYILDELSIPDRDNYLMQAIVAVE